MIKEIEINVFADRILDQTFILEVCAKKCGVKTTDIDDLIYVKRSIDARSSRPFFLLRIHVYLGEKYLPPSSIHLTYKNVQSAREVVIIGAGPAGYFAALELISLGLKPIILERGKDAQSRRRDLKAIQQDGIVNPHSNYCFGEGGAGTYSDGKLYTRSHKRGSIQKVLQQLVEHGSNPDIMIDAHPHIGSNKLPGIVASIRETIINFGGEVHFNSQVVDFEIRDRKLYSCSTVDGRVFVANAFLLATGHSARDIYYLLEKKGVRLEAKAFALGLRIEHSQYYIDTLQYKQSIREENLPAASYSAVSQINGIGVFSFCMCPGGLVVPASTAPGEIVVNGMSLSRRDSPFANSGLVTSISIEELEAHGYKGTFACMDFQSKVEQDMFALGDGSQKAPAQRVADFVAGSLSKDLFNTSYIPGLISAPLHEALPDFISERLRKAIKDIDKKMRGYLSLDANVIGTESRTSAPVKIPRDKDTYMHTEISGLFPCGEGAGYAGGILSAAMDGQAVARAIANHLS